MKIKIACEIAAINLVIHHYVRNLNETKKKILKNIVHILSYYDFIIKKIFKTRRLRLNVIGIYNYLMSLRDIEVL